MMSRSSGRPLQRKFCIVDAAVWYNLALLFSKKPIHVNNNCRFLFFTTPCYRANICASEWKDNRTQRTVPRCPCNSIHAGHRANQSP